MLEPTQANSATQNLNYVSNIHSGYEQSAIMNDQLDKLKRMQEEIDRKNQEDRDDTTRMINEIMN